MPEAVRHSGLGMQAVLNGLHKVVYRLSRILNGIGVVALFGMMALITADVCLRYLLNRPILGTFEVVQLMLALVVFFGLAHTSQRGGHIAVEAVYAILPDKGRLIAALVSSILSLGFFVVVVYSMICIAKEQVVTHAQSGVLPLPVYPVTVAVCFALTLLWFALLEEFIDVVRKGPRE